MIDNQRTLRKFVVTAGVALAAALAGGCGTANDGQDAVADGTAAPTTTAAAEPAGGKLPTAACPLVDKALLPTLFKVHEPAPDEKDPVKAGKATTYSCDVSDGEQLFLTVGVSVAPRSGTAEANVRAALDGAPAEPVSGVGEVGAFGAKDGVGTVVGIKTVGEKHVLVFVHGAADDKKQLISVAKSAAGRV